MKFGWIVLLFWLPVSGSAQNSYAGDWLVSYWDYEHLKIQREKQDSLMAELSKLPLDSLHGVYEKLQQFRYSPKNSDYFDELYDFFSIHLEPGGSYLQAFHKQKIPLKVESRGDTLQLYSDAVFAQMIPIDSGNVQLFSGEKGDNLKEFILKKLNQGNFDKQALAKLKREIRHYDWLVSYENQEQSDTLRKGDTKQFNFINGNIIIGIGEAGKISSGTLIVHSIHGKHLSGEISSPLGLIKLSKDYTRAEFKTCRLTPISE